MDPFTPTCLHGSLQNILSLHYLQRFSSISETVPVPFDIYMNVITIHK